MENKYCAIYLSGTGNTEFCISKLAKMLDENAPVVAIEDRDAVSTAAAYNNIILGYPVQFSNAPKMVRDFITQNAALWKGKKVLCLATMGAFSGERCGMCGETFEKARRDGFGRSAYQNAGQRVRQQASQEEHR